MKRRVLLVVTGLVLAAWTVAQVASTSGNSVPETSAGVAYAAITPRSLAPPECAGLNLTNLVAVDFVAGLGTEGNDLLIGGPLALGLVGQGGDDCVVGSSGAVYEIVGGDGFDVCIGGLGALFLDCEVTVLR